MNDWLFRKRNTIKKTTQITKKVLVQPSEPISHDAQNKTRPRKMDAYDHVKLQHVATFWCISGYCGTCCNILHQFGTKRGSCLEHCWVIVGTLFDHVWYTCRIISATVWDTFSIMFGTCWGHVWVMLGNVCGSRLDDLGCICRLHRSVFAVRQTAVCHATLGRPSPDARPPAAFDLDLMPCVPPAGNPGSIPGGRTLCPAAGALLCIAADCSVLRESRAHRPARRARPRSRAQSAT